MIESSASDDQLMLVLLASSNKGKKQMIYRQVILCVGVLSRISNFLGKKKMSCLELTFKLGSWTYSLTDTYLLAAIGAFTSCSVKPLDTNSEWRDLNSQSVSRSCQNRTHTIKTSAVNIEKQALGTVFVL